MQFSNLYTVGFAAAVCAVCSILVSSSATFLKEKQIANALLAKQQNVLAVSGLMERGAKLNSEEVQAIFDEKIRIKVVELESGGDVPVDQIDPVTYDQWKIKNDPAMNRDVPENRAKVSQVPLYATIYQVMGDGGEVDLYVLPVEGKGLWSTLYGFLAVDRDCTTIRGLTFYNHGETPGLGGEIDNPLWTAKWVGRKAYDENWVPKVQVIKGIAGKPDVDPHKVDGLSGATLTSNGVTNLLQFWLGDNGFKPYLTKLHSEGSKA